MEEWTRDDRWISNYGDGPLVAEILYVANGIAEMRRWNKDRKKATLYTNFKLSFNALVNNETGWRKDASK